MKYGVGGEVWKKGKQLIINPKTSSPVLFLKNIPMSQLLEEKIKLKHTRCYLQAGENNTHTHVYIHIYAHIHNTHTHTLNSSHENDEGCALQKNGFCAGDYPAVGQRPGKPTTSQGFGSEGAATQREISQPFFATLKT